LAFTIKLFGERKQTMAKRLGLIADIGGTNARFALSDENGFYDEKILVCANYGSLVAATKEYLDGLTGEKPEHAAIAIAGPVQGDWIEMTNLDWKFSIEESRKSLGLKSLTLMNDFKAVALCIPHLKDGDFTQIFGNQKPVEYAPIGIIGPGTGLGVASLVWNNGRYEAVAGEGGHITMPAKTQREFDVFQAIKKTLDHTHVSAERVCSGKGLEKLYASIRELNGRHDLPKERTAEEIGKAGMDKSCEVCIEALDLMQGFLGTVASDLAVMVGAKGGIYIAGGIPAKLGDHFLQSRFRQQFEDKGRMVEFVKPIPTYLITHKYPALLGLQHHLLDGAPTL
jgi:glucokinase